MSRKRFIESHGATCRNWIWSWSFINKTDKFIIFGAWDRYKRGKKVWVLKEEWEKPPLRRKLAGYGQAREHIRLIEKERYKLKTFPMSYSDSNKNKNGIGPAKIGNFIPKLASKCLERGKNGWYAVDT